jgi:hypothetical protein
MALWRKKGEVEGTYYYERFFEGGPLLSTSR